LLANTLLAAVGLPLPDGPLTLIEQGVNNKLELSLRDHQVTLTGTVPSVPWARHVRGMVVAGRAGKDNVLALVPGDAKGLSIAPSLSVSREPHDTVTFSNCVTDLAVRYD